MNTEENNREPEEPTPGFAPDETDEAKEEETSAETEREKKAADDNDAGGSGETDPETGDDVVDGIGSASVFDVGSVDDDAARIEELELELGQAVRERDECMDSMLRLRAEFDNSRKRLERERERILQTASERILVSLLPVLDNLDRALQFEGDVREGVRATRDQLSEVLDREGLLPVESDGEHFDPSVHEAVMSKPSEEHEEGTILQTFERGYLLNGKAVRVAKVVVAQ